MREGLVTHALAKARTYSQWRLKLVALRRDRMEGQVIVYSYVGDNVEVFDWITYGRFRERIHGNGCVPGFMGLVFVSPVSGAAP